MSALWHPVGPEPERTYWIRRAIVVLALLLVLALLVWLVQAALGGRTPATTPALPSASQAVPGGSATVVDDSTASGTPTPAEADGSSTPETSATSSEASPTPTPASSPPSPRPTPTPTPTPTGPVACDPAALDLSITGARRVTPGRNTTFTITGVNRSSTTCVLSFAQTPFELRIHSGTDRIWSSNDCGQWRARGTITLAPGKAWTWRPIWPAKRSAADCTLTDDVLRSGTYVANADLTGADTKQFVFQVSG
ncbi:hypothetical protein [Aestuariimicrobium ganziense]|uniref:hypothetical protein n=1 Tax=Aestuariimicrobium ganziense TaxID=2773677 RepID=UPI001945664F|nr:hypothetical protein [Aestuariimicrobium ganziense]